MADKQRQKHIPIFEAIFENGVLKPVNDPGLPEHRRYSVRIQEVEELPGSETLAGWHQVYEGLSEEDQAAVEAMALDRSRFFRVQPR
jgi:predicted DNA-binding antitoxin AbrB/MazE fold protein